MSAAPYFILTGGYLISMICFVTAIASCNPDNKSLKTEKCTSISTSCRMHKIEKEIAIIKTVLICQKIMPLELAEDIIKSEEPLKP